MAKKPNNAYRLMNAKDLILEAERVLAMMKSSPIFQGPLPGSVPSCEKFEGGLGVLKSTYLAALTHDSINIRLRNEARLEMIRMMDAVAGFIVLEGSIKPEVLNDLPFSKRKTVNKGFDPHGVLFAPKFTVDIGPLPNTMTGTASRLVGARSFEVEVNEIDPNNEAAWYHKATFVLPTDMVMRGFDTTKPYSFRARGIAVAGPGAWSVPFTVKPK